MGDSKPPTEYWVSELDQAQETYRFFLQASHNLLYYAYGALFAMVALWGSQLAAIQSLTPEWMAAAFVAMAITISAVAVIFLLTVTVGDTWRNAVGNHQRRWELAAGSLGGTDGWQQTRKALSSYPVPRGSLHSSLFVARLLSWSGLAASLALAISVPVLAKAAIPDGEIAQSSLRFSALAPAGAVAVIVVGVLLRLAAAPVEHWRDKLADWLSERGTVLRRLFQQQHVAERYLWNCIVVTAVAALAAGTYYSIVTLAA